MTELITYGRDSEHTALRDALHASNDGELVDLIIGLSNLATILLVRIEKHTGVLPEESLREIALKYGPR